MYDLIIRGGNVVDPSQGWHGPADIAIQDGRIAALDKHIAAAAKKELDAAGLIVTPGLVDIHIHAFQHVSHYGIDPDYTCLATGSTTVVDAGTAGRATWPGLLHLVMEKAKTRMRAFLHISGMGLLTDFIGESSDLRWLDPVSTAVIAADYADWICGIKVRMDVNRVGDSGLEPLKRAIQAAAHIGKPVMAHVGNTPASLGEITALMRPGDIITHSFHGWKHGVLDENGQVFPELRQAAERGIIFDVGHGAGSFSFPVAEAALRQNFLPATISTDLHVYSEHGPAYDLPTVMSKFLYLGMSLDEVVERTTIVAAKAVGMGDVAGSLAIGRVADVTLLQEIEGRFPFEDCSAHVHLAPRTLVPRNVVLGGEVLPAQTAAPWRLA